MSLLSTNIRGVASAVDLAVGHQEGRRHAALGQRRRGRGLLSACSRGVAPPWTWRLAVKRPSTLPCLHAQCSPQSLWARSMCICVGYGSGGVPQFALLLAAIEVSPAGSGEGVGVGVGGGE